MRPGGGQLTCSCRADGDPSEPGRLSLNLVLPQMPVTRSVAVRPAHPCVTSQRADPKPLFGKGRSKRSNAG